MIKSILDTDLYKLTMGQAIMRCFPNLEVEYTLNIRKKREFPILFDHALRGSILQFQDLKLTNEEYTFLQEKCPFLSPMYLDYLKRYQFNPDEVDIKIKDDLLTLKIRGYWFRTVYWEVPLMAEISELFFENKSIEDRNFRQENNHTKAVKFETHGIKFADFGTRRRHSFKNHDEVVADFKKYASKSFIGTSNPYLAMKYEIKPIGTIAHEFIMVIAALHGYRGANKAAMREWASVYGGQLGIMLTDTFTSDVFFREFTMDYAKLYDGIRQDSGDPIEFVKKAIDHYKKLKIDPKTKTVVFSDSLDPTKVVEIHNFCKNKIKDSYGIGTNLTNNIGSEPLNMVIKLTAVKINDKWIPTIKLSDDAGKYTGPVKDINLCKQILNNNI